jgi:hypothetical protein
MAAEFPTPLTIRRESEVVERVGSPSHGVRHPDPLRIIARHLARQAAAEFLETARAVSASQMA